MEHRNPSSTRRVYPKMRCRTWLSIAIAAAVTGCGSAGNPTITGTSDATTVSTGDPTKTAASSGTPGPITPGKIEVRLSKTSYQLGEVVQVTVSNGLDKPIYTEDFKTDCTIITWQRLSAGSWTDISGCALGRPTATITVQASAAHSVTIDPNSFHLRDTPPRAGTHRIQFSYRATREPSGGETLAVYSAQFAVQ